jgi:exodeoxyribonuclease-3
MQETKLADSAFPYLVFESLGYQVAHVGAGRWNGVAIASRVGLEPLCQGFVDVEEPLTEPRLVGANCGGISVYSVYVPNGRALDDPHYQFKLSWFEHLQSLLETAHTPADEVIVAGDFNVAPHDIDVFDPKKLIGATHVSEPERAAIQKLEAWGLVDVFRARYADPGLYSWWDYRGGDFHMGRGMRIDLLLATQSVARATSFVLMDRQARKGTKPSDHAPVFMDVDR